MQRRGINKGADNISFVSASAATDIYNELEYIEVCSLIKTLPREISVPLMMYSRGYKYSEIAAFQNLPNTAVSSRKTRNG